MAGEATEQRWTAGRVAMMGFGLGAMLLAIPLPFVLPMWIGAGTVPVMAGLLGVSIAIVAVIGLRAAAGQSVGASRCSCGYDLRHLKARAESVHDFDVDGRLRAAKRDVTCPECGREHTVWVDVAATAENRVESL